MTLRQKRKSVDDDSLKEISGSAQIKRAKKMNNILDHASMKDKDGKASLMAKIIDQEGEEFGANVEKKSKVMQQNKTLNPEQTSGLMTTTRGSEYMWRQSRTFFKNTLGFSPISSQKKVDLYRKKIMAKGKGIASVQVDSSSVVRVTLVSTPALAAVSIQERTCVVV